MKEIMDREPFLRITVQEVGPKGFGDVISIETDVYDHTDLSLIDLDDYLCHAEGPEFDERKGEDRIWTFSLWDSEDNYMSGLPPILTKEEYESEYWRRVEKFEKGFRQKG